MVRESRMNIRYLFTFAIFLATVGAFIWGCQGNQPVSPVRDAVMSVYVPQSAEVKSSLLGVASNELLYSVNGPGLGSSVTGTVGPFSTASNSGSFDFTVDVPQQDNLVLSLQLNDASSNQPLAIGAAGLNLLSSAVSNVVVDMGSVTRNCYTLNVPGTGNYYTTDIYTFATDNLIGNTCTGGDFYFNYSIGSNAPLTISSGPLTSCGAPLTSIAYLGNGNFVDYDYVPPASAFQTDSSVAKGSPVSVNDIFCLKLLSVPATGGGHAWLQVTGVPQTLVTGGTVGPTFRYRVNSTLPYYGYEQTTADLTNTCSTSY